MKRTLAAFAATAMCFTGSAVLAVSAQAAPASRTSQITQASHTSHIVSNVAKAKKKPKKYANCASLHKDYEHGIRKKGAKDKVRGSSDPVPSRLIPIRTPLYKANTKLDRDKDGVACEAR